MLLRRLGVTLKLGGRPERTAWVRWRQSRLRRRSAIRHGGARRAPRVRRDGVRQPSSSRIGHRRAPRDGQGLLRAGRLDLPVPEIDDLRVAGRHRHATRRGERSSGASRQTDRPRRRAARPPLTRAVLGSRGGGRRRSPTRRGDRASRRRSGAASRSRSPAGGAGGRVATSGCCRSRGDRASAEIAVRCSPSRCSSGSARCRASRGSSRRHPSSAGSTARARAGGTARGGAAPTAPAIYCRRCGRTGWMAQSSELNGGLLVRRDRRLRRQRPQQPAAPGADPGRPGGAGRPVPRSRGVVLHAEPKPACRRCS